MINVDSFSFSEQSPWLALEHSSIFSPLSCGSSSSQSLCSIIQTAQHGWQSRTHLGLGQWSTFWFISLSSCDAASCQFQTCASWGWAKNLYPVLRDSIFQLLSVCDFPHTFQLWESPFFCFWLQSWILTYLHCCILSTNGSAFVSRLRTEKK